MKERPFVKLVAELALIVIPTIAVGWILIEKTNSYLSFLNMKPLWQLGFFTTGLSIAYILYFIRLRFLISFGLLIGSLYLGYHSIDKFYPGEFDSFFISVQFIQYSVIFLIGWIAGYGLTRFRYFVVVFTCFLSAINIILLARSSELHIEDIFWFFFPVLFYTIYLLYVRELIHTVFQAEKNKVLILIRRLTLFIVFLLLIFWGAYYLMTVKYDQIIASIGKKSSSQSKSKNEGNLIKKNDDDTFDLEKFAELRSRLDRPNEQLLFCAYLDNFFDADPPVPNPLYFTCYYLTKYDTKRERFEMDPFMPSSDQFNPDPSKIPLFFTQRDTTIIPNSKSSIYRKVKEVDIYLNKLSPRTFTAPSTAFACQSISVQDDFKDQFKSAYRAMCYVSDLNSAYFVYNVDHPVIKQFAEMRRQVLSSVKNYKKEDTVFLKYYTYLPKGSVFDSIRTLANTITKGATIPIDKVNRIKDYFLSKDSLGKPLFKYTLLPGSHDIKDNQGLQNVSNLSYFLFKNRKGYCTYFAGSTLFLLRSCGIPSRMAVGFLTQNRSNKNPGWYWFYSDQAHAWVEVYFPGYGWLDFDTTIGDNEARESEKPDGTPPGQPPKAWFAGKGLIVRKDTITKTLALNLREMVFHDQEFEVNPSDTVNLNISHAIIKYEDAPIALDSLKVGDYILAISYDSKMEKIKSVSSPKQFKTLLDRFPAQLPIDEIHLLSGEELKKDEEKKKTPAQEKYDWFKKITKTILILIGCLILFLIIVPLVCYMYLRIRAKSARKPHQKAYWLYRYTMFLCNQMGLVRKHETPLEYAKTVVDPVMQVSFTAFISIYLKSKYAPIPLDVQEIEFLNDFYPQFNKRIKKYFSVKKRIAQFLNSRLTYHFFIKPKE